MNFRIIRKFSAHDMVSDMDFDGSKKLIGRGAQAEVYCYHGYAYKVYKPTYPEEWIAFEKHQQQVVNQLGLCPVRYYDTDDAHIIKMDLIEGIQLEEKVLSGYLEGFGLLAEAFRRVHAVDVTAQDVQMPRLTDTAGMGLSDEEKNKIFPLIERLFEKYPACVCHLDMHFLNIMLPENGGDGAAASSETATRDTADGAAAFAGEDFIIIDWMNARIAPALFDYARTYVIFDEFSKEALEIYKKVVAQDIETLGIFDSDFADAVEVCKVIRKREKES